MLTMRPLRLRLFEKIEDAEAYSLFHEAPFQRMHEVVIDMVRPQFLQLRR